MNNYNTKQRELLLLFLETNADKQFTVDEIYREINNISKSAIYRNISELLRNGRVQRFSQCNTRAFLYQYRGNKDCKDHLHTTCKKCGAIFHIDSKTTTDVVAIFRKQLGFEIDYTKTILMGYCSACK